MHRLVPDLIQEKYASGETEGSFHASAIFVDISGFTAISDALMGHGQHGAEVLANITRDVFDRLMRSVFEQGGFVTNLAGDAFTAVFPSEDGPLSTIRSALAAAWQMQQATAASAQIETTYGSFAVSAKVGVASGDITWGIVSSNDQSRAAYYFQGTAIDGCVQAEKLAQAGEIVVDAAVFQAMGSQITAEAVEDYFLITGLSGTLPAAQPINLRPVVPETSTHFFPSEVIQPGLSGEFRQVVSMFVSLPTVQTVEQLAIFMQIVFGLQDRYGGLLNRLDFGDKGASLLLFWGAPVAHENDVARALNFILDLQARTVVPVNSGISYRIAHGGYSGSEFAGEYTCHGRGTTLAARMMQASPRGEIWVDENIAERARHHFELEFEDEMAFKGFAQAEKVFVLLERKEESEHFFKGEMVGREVEKRKLADFVRPIRQGRHPGAMVIWGEAGIGKSRLVQEFLKFLDSPDDEVSVFVCRTDEILREPLNPLRYWLRRHFGQSEQQSDARNKRSFNRKLDELIATAPDEDLTRELDRTRSFLGALINLRWPDSLYEQLDAQGRYENSFTGLITLLMAESMQRPVILLLEDAHWLDGDSRAFLRQLTRTLDHESSYPIAILATARSEGDRAVLGDEVKFQEVDLGQLSPDDMAILAAKQLGSPVGPGLRNLLVERAEGNPFFAEQILSYLQEQNLLLPAEDGWELRAKQGSALPGDVSAVLVARLDRLTREVKDVVQTASVIGREFEVRLLSRMLWDDPRVREKVDDAEELSIWSPLNELRYLFKHALLRDAAYHMQVRSRRQALHRLAAEALEDLYRDDLSPHYGELAYHTEEARLIDQACHYLELAGEASEAAYHVSLATDYYCRALNLTPDENLESRYRLLRARERLYDMQGDRQEQLQDQRLMSELAEALADGSKQAEVHMRRAWLDYWRGDYQEAVEAAEQAANVAKTAGDQRLLGQAYYARAWVSYQLGHIDEAGLDAQKALAAAHEAGDPRDAGNALNILGIIDLAAGDYIATRAHLQDFLANSREIKDWEREATALGNLGVVHTLLGQYSTAKAYYRESLELSREMGSRKWLAVESINLSWLASSQGEWEAAVEHGEAGTAIARETNWQGIEVDGLIWLGHAWLGLGNIENALATYQRALELRRKMGQESLAVEALAGMARTNLARGDLDSAGAYVTEILSHLREVGSLAGTWEPIRTYLTCYQVLKAAGDPRADEILETAYQELRRLAGRILNADDRRMFLENVSWHREVVATYLKVHSG